MYTAHRFDLVIPDSTYLLSCTAAYATARGVFVRFKIIFQGHPTYPYEVDVLSATVEDSNGSKFKPKYVLKLVIGIKSVAVIIWPY